MTSSSSDRPPRHEFSSRVRRLIEFQLDKSDAEVTRVAPEAATPTIIDPSTPADPPEEP